MHISLDTSSTSHIIILLQHLSTIFNSVFTNENEVSNAQRCSASDCTCVLTRIDHCLVNNSYHDVRSQIDMACPSISNFLFSNLV